MSRLQAIQSDAATGKAKELLDAVQAKLKITPNMTRIGASFLLKLLLRDRISLAWTPFYGSARRS
jgi:hypothetical protein